MEEKAPEKGKKVPKKRGKGDKLTKAEETFCNEYIIDHNASRAAREAGWPPNTAGFYGHSLLKSAKIQLRIDELREEFKIGFNPAREKMVRELSNLAYNRGTGLFNPDGTLKPVTEMDEDDFALINGFDVEEIKAFGQSIGVLKKIKRNRPVEAMALMAKICGYEAATKTDITSGGQPLAAVAIVQIPSNGRQTETAGPDNSTAAGLSNEGS